MQERLIFEFKSSQNLQPDLRKARALEYIAHYLDRIEQHLGKISDHIDKENIEGAISGASASIADQVRLAAATLTGPK